MVNKSGNSISGGGAETSHRCGRFCLGPLTFHCQAVGEEVQLSHGCRLAERTVSTFKNGLVFSNRPVKVKERIQLRVEKDLFNWHGALRVGFTNVPPSARILPLPCLAIPSLTNNPGHWAAPVDESFCQAGSELQFWVSRGGSVYVASNSCRKHKLLTGVNLSQPLWAMIDIYGQTCAIYLMGSEKKKLFYTRKSCPAPITLSSPDVNNSHSLIHGVSAYNRNSVECISCIDMIPADEGCVVCMGKEASITLPCGHRCMCKQCTQKVFHMFGTCPLCRHKIGAP
ncbi:E3 ubiquitin-protein ligase NEURL3 [Mastacembelus armatus]|uniref:E3 ubiquitin-protein ligase NEURL3 n=1 Tax=Mastacembelus armatus TaxID=205130 RepID=UPI000E45B6E8|nr:E3 ubiquitin-protein ligase NEURL3 [Mastacembelus armatus]